MNTQRTEEFAKVCKELSTYFFDVAPNPRLTKRQGQGYEYEEKYISSYDELKKQAINGDVELPPHNLQELKQAYSDFQNESNENVAISDSGFVKKLVIHFLDGCLPYEKLMPFEEQFFRERMFDEAELLYTFKAISRELNQKYGTLSLMNDQLPF